MAYHKGMSLAHSYSSSWATTYTVIYSLSAACSSMTSKQPTMYISSSESCSRWWNRQKYMIYFKRYQRVNTPLQLTSLLYLPTHPSATVPLPQVTTQHKIKHRMHLIVGEAYIHAKDVRTSQVINLPPKLHGTGSGTTRVIQVICCISLYN